MRDPFRRHRRVETYAVALGLFAGTACTGDIGNLDANGIEPPGSGPSGRPDPAIADQHTATGARRLTRFEYGHTVRDLLGVEDAEAELSEAAPVDFLTNNAHALTMSLTELERFARAAERVSTASLDVLPLPDGCSIDDDDDACVDGFIDAFLPRAFRRPVSAEEKARYRSVYDAVRPDATPQEALRSVVESVLMSPRFLYRDEAAEDGKLDGYQVASRLSYLLWASMPDAALFDAAASGDLLRAEGLDAQVARLLADPRAERGVVRFVAEWLGFGNAELARKGADVIRDLPDTLQGDLEEETRRFVIDALLGPDHSLTTLLTARYSFINEDIAEIYGIDGVSGSELRRVELDGAERRGILTQPLLLASQTKESGYSVVQMGRFVRQRLLCQDVLPPPPGVSTEFDESESAAGLTYRELFDRKTGGQPCSSCHTFLNPPGYAFLPYDPVGRFSTHDADDKPFDTRGEVTALDGKAAPFTDATSMIDTLVASDALGSCFTRRYLEFTFGRTVAEEDLPLYHQLADGLRDSNGDFVGFLATLVASPDFGAAGPQGGE